MSNVTLINRIFMRFIKEYNLHEYFKKSNISQFDINSTIMYIIDRNKHNTFMPYIPVLNYINKTLAHKIHPLLYAFFKKTNIQNYFDDLIFEYCKTDVINYMINNNLTSKVIEKINNDSNSIKFYECKNKMQIFNLIFLDFDLSTKNFAEYNKYIMIYNNLIQYIYITLLKRYEYCSKNINNSIQEK